MKITTIFYDCVGPLLIKDESIIVDPLVAEIDKMCGLVTNDKIFWKEIAEKYDLSQIQIENVINNILGSYKKNQPMWDFHESIRNKYKTAVINNGTSTIFERWVKKFEMNKMFNNLFNSSLLGVKKPDKKIFEIVAEKLESVLSDCLLIDDSQFNVDGAINAGLSGVFYDPYSHQRFLSEINSILLE